ncbi:MAG: ATP synthase F0 subunit B, partial [Smithellaceae bacterium]|nr:ATP synthase F0 subunit B [Smithellaceae bacterium]
MRPRQDLTPGYPRSSIAGKALFLAAALVLAGFSPVAAAGEGGEGSFADFGWRVVNFTVLAGLLFYLLAKMIREFFVGRRDAIAKALKDAEAAAEEAQSKYREYSARLAAAEGEIEALSRMIESQGRAERDKILAEANLMAERIKEETKTRMEQGYARARDQLKAEAVNLSLSLAEELLRARITGEDQDKLVRESLERFDRENMRVDLR